MITVIIRLSVKDLVNDVTVDTSDLCFLFRPTNYHMSVAGNSVDKYDWLGLIGTRLFVRPTSAHGGHDP